MSWAIAFSGESEIASRADFSASSRSPRWAATKATMAWAPPSLGGKLDRFLEFGKGLLEVLLLELCESERVVGAGMVRIELHRFLEMRNRRVPVLPLQGDPAFQVVPLRELGLFADEGVGFLFRRAGVLLVHGHARQEDAGRDFLGAHVQDVSIGRFGLGAIPSALARLALA